MKNLAVTLYIKLVLILALTLLSANAKAGLLTLDVEDLDYQVGDTVTVDVVASDFVNSFGFVEAIRGFSFTTLFNADVLEFSSVSFGNGLDVGIFGSLQLEPTDPSDIVISETSLEDSSMLLFEQLASPSLILATLSFDIIGTGTSIFNLMDVSVSGGSLFSPSEFTNVSIQGASIEVADSAEIPVPPTLFLLALPLLFVVRNARRK